jgi:capsular polysaccharide biosynthesis protein
MTEYNQNSITQLGPIQTDDENSIDLAELFYVLHEHLGKIILVTLFGALIAFGITKTLITPKFTASSKIYVVSTQDGSEVNLTDLNTGTQLTVDYSQLLLARPFLTEVAEALELDMSVETLDDLITIGNDSRILKISVTSEDPELAADIANQIATSAQDYLPKIMGTNPPSIIENAIVPTSQSSPSYIKNTLLGAVAGFVLSAGYYIIRFLMNDTCETGEDITRTFGIPPLAVIPEEQVGKKKNSKRNTKVNKKRKGAR